MSDNVREAVDWNSIAADAARFGRGGASIVAKRAREREAELLAALAAPSSESPAATGSGAAPTRDAVAEVLFNARHLDNAGVPWSDIVASANVGAIVEVDIARRQADAVMARWPGAATGPRDEAGVLVWGILGTETLVNDDSGNPCVYYDEAEAREALDEWRRASTTLTAHYRVVALVPRESPSEESRSDDNEGRKAREEPAT